MKTYAESRGQTPFDWNAFLKRLDITLGQWEEAINLSKSWVTCACGNQCDVLKRESDGTPQDKPLAYLGGQDGFHGSIMCHDVEGAKHYLNLIEQHVGYLIELRRRELRMQLESLS